MKFNLTDPDGWFEGLRCGTFPNQTEDASGKPVYVAQVVGPEDLRLLVANWEAMGRPELLIDRDHHSADAGKTTEAMGWLTDLRISNDRLLGKARWSDDGEAALLGGRYRYCSLTLDCDRVPGQPAGAGGTAGHRTKVRPLYIESIALTNRPAVGGLKPVANRAEATPSILSPANPIPTNPTMDLTKLAVELKLPPASSLEDITAEVVRLKNRETEAGKATANETLIRFKNRIPAGQEDFFRESLTANRAATVKLLESLPEPKAEEPTTRVHNRETAKTKGTPAAVTEGDSPTPAELAGKQRAHLLELRNRLPNAKQSSLVLQARDEKPEIWPA